MKKLFFLPIIFFACSEQAETEKRSEMYTASSDTAKKVAAKKPGKQSMTLIPILTREEEDSVVFFKLTQSLCINARLPDSVMYEPDSLKHNPDSSMQKYRFAKTYLMKIMAGTDSTVDWLEVRYDFEDRRIKNRYYVRNDIIKTIGVPDSIERTTFYVWKDSAGTVLYRPLSYELYINDKIVDADTLALAAYTPAAMSDVEKIFKKYAKHASKVIQTGSH